jgi:hypothetical protein
VDDRLLSVATGRGGLQRERLGDPVGAPTPASGQVAQELAHPLALAPAEVRAAERLSEPDQVGQGHPGVEQLLVELGRGGTHAGIGELVIDDQGCLIQAAHLEVQSAARPGPRLVECRQGQGGQPVSPGRIGPLGPPQGPAAGFVEYAGLDRDRDH